MIVTIPATNGQRLPTLGPQVVDWMERNLVHGPGDLRGEPLVLSGLWRAIITRAYEVWPRQHDRAGRRRWKRVVAELPKGLAKTEVGALLAVTESHPEAPVRTIGWDGDEPIGGPVTDPFVPIISYTAEQAETLAYSVVYSVLGDDACAASMAFNSGIEMTTRADGSGLIKAFSGSPSARDGARTTFALLDETHRHRTPRLVEAAHVMRQDTFKRHAADAWMLEVTTAWSPGERSTAERSWEYAVAVSEGRVPEDSQFLYIALRASDHHDVTTPEGLRAALVEARGPAVAWTDIDALLTEWTDPTIDASYLERIWLGWPRSSRTRWVQAGEWDALERPAEPEGDDEPVVLGFDGARTQDSTALVASRLSDGWSTVVGMWERPAGMSETDEWEVDDTEVDAAVTAMIESGRVVLMYADPPWWREWLAEWQRRWPDVVRPWDTNRPTQMAASLHETRLGLAPHDGDPRLRRHVLAADRKVVPVWIDPETQGYVLRKPPSGEKIDAAMAYALAQEARRDAIRRGLVTRRRRTKRLITF